MNSKNLVMDNRDYIIGLRRYFHKYPELSWKEHETAKKIREELTKLNIPYVEVAGTGTVATLRGQKDTPVIGLRCDIDGLPIQEVKDLEFKSLNDGCMHACGHDAHIAMLLGAAKILSENKENLACTVKFIFQPAEECFQGAKKIIESGEVDDVESFVGMHIFPYIDAGKISVDAGPRYTSADSMKIKIIGKSGHGAMPQFAVDPIYVGSQVVNGLQAIVSRECNPADTVVVSVCTFHSGTLSNIFEQTAELSGTIRTFNPELRKELPEKIERIIKGITESHRATYEFEYIHGVPVTMNTEACSVIAKKAVEKILGENGVEVYAGMPGGEDFALYVENKPGLYAFVGCRNEKNDQNYSLHHERFDLDEDGMLNGAAFYVEYVNTLLSCD